MFERFQRSERFRRVNRTGSDGAANGSNAPDAGTARTSVVDRPTTEQAAPERPTIDTPAATDMRAAERPVATRPVRPAAPAGPATVEEARAVQRERFGGADGTAIFFGWLSALGLAALLLAVVAAAGTRLGLAEGVTPGDATAHADTIGIVGAAILVAILLLAYYAGGYVAGRMARFDGGRQGFRVWLLGLLATIAAAVAGWVGGSQYNVFQQLHLPRVPVNEGALTTGGIITLAVALLGTLLAAVAGGKAGDRYHARIDQAGWEATRRR
jgi:hypothetical protein